MWQDKATHANAAFRKLRPVMPKQPSMIPPDSYELFFNDLKKRIETVRVKADLAVKKELILLYWQIGVQILAKQEEESWGRKVITHLARDLSQAFPDRTGLSSLNLKYMKAFASAVPDASIVQEVIAQSIWYHPLALLLLRRSVTVL
jgi:hypothetical protein